ncbi:nuclear envelope integral membrane protein 1 isoform X2 [Hyposmocoma kahamanoa]|uniref:nuclear envelope integral membrane protein 1 isoform X2 n=1 Tax=Hyposmocoma kahamanoa TaxID=1477025 RepID=UPI000E6DA143|nr:nuclear envelope integral membrane protein 1 isoform X2 [Hyposmocoma kahamanoa]
MEIRVCSCAFLLWFCVLFTQANSSNYNAHWLGGSTTIEKDGTMGQKVDIYCYSGTPKSVLALWQTIKFNLKIKNEEFDMYFGSSPEEVFKQYTEDSYGWAVINPFSQKTQRSVSVDLFLPTCMAVNTKQRHTIELQVIRVDIWRVFLMCLGITLIFLSRTLSGNSVFFYLCGMFIGVFASFMVLVYYVSRMLPRKILTYGILIGGWTVGVYLFQQLWDNIRMIILLHQSYSFWYTVIMSFISFLVCYRIGPPRNQRSKNLVMWILQAVGVLMIFFSSEYQEASAAIIVISLCVKYFPDSLIHKIQGYWRRRFPPKLRLLTSEEYYEEGARETKKALDNLRKYCSSPDCAQWKVMLKLNDSRRFASFVEGNSHLSDDEIVDYEAYAFSLDRKEKRIPLANSTSTMEISDDDEISSDDEN